MQYGALGNIFCFAVTQLVNLQNVGKTREKEESREGGIGSAHLMRAFVKHRDDAQSPFTLHCASSDLILLIVHSGRSTKPEACCKLLLRKQQR